MKKFNFVFPIRILATLAILVVVWQHSHWSVALAITMISISIEGISAILQKIARSTRALRQQQESMIRQLNMGAAAVAKEMSTCHECEQHGAQGIRMGSVHNRHAPNCLMYYGKEHAKTS